MKYVKSYESFNSVSTEDKLESIRSFNQYLIENLNANSSLYGYWKNRFDKIFLLPGQKTGDKWDSLLKEEAINLLYPISLSKRHSDELIEVIKDILADMEDENLMKVNSVLKSYDMNIKNSDGSLIPRYLVLYKTEPKEVWKNKPAGPFMVGDKKYANFVYSKYETFLGYGLKMTHVNSSKITFSEI